LGATVHAFDIFLHKYKLFSLKFFIWLSKNHRVMLCRTCTYSVLLCLYDSFWADVIFLFPDQPVDC
jgi:hypothetical protein